MRSLRNNGLGDDALVRQDAERERRCEVPHLAEIFGDSHGPVFSAVMVKIDDYGTEVFQAALENAGRFGGWFWHCIGCVNG